LLSSNFSALKALELLCSKSGVVRFQKRAKWGGLLVFFFLLRKGTDGSVMWAFLDLF